MVYVNNTYKDLFVWQKAMELVLDIYRLTDNFPKNEVYGLSLQMRRCAVSIPSNIAEGRRRGTANEFKRFLLISFGSGAELETQLEISRKLNFGYEQDYQKIEEKLEEVMKMLNKLIRKVGE